MLEKLQEKFEQAAKQAEVYNRKLDETFKDPLARQTSWKPVERGGSSGRSRTLKQINPTRLEFKAAPLTLVLAGLAIAVGILVALTGFIGAGSADWNRVVISIPLTAAGLFFWFQLTRPAILDKQTGFYWVGRNAPASPSAAREQANATMLSDVGAVQVIAEDVRTERGRTFRSFEINLVLYDGSRLNLVDHAKLSVIKADAQRVAEFLQVPLWDASELI